MVQNWGNYPEMFDKNAFEKNRVLQKLPKATKDILSRVLDNHCTVQFCGILKFSTYEGQVYQYKAGWPFQKADEHLQNRVNSWEVLFEKTTEEKVILNAYDVSSIPFKNIPMTLLKTHSTRVTGTGCSIPDAVRDAELKLGLAIANVEF